MARAKAARAWRSRPLQEVDVVILGDDVAVALAAVNAVDSAVDLQDHRSLLEDRVGKPLRSPHHLGLPARRRMQELADVFAERDVREHVEGLVGLDEGALERVVVVGRDNKLIARLAEHLLECSRQSSQELVELRRLVVRIEDLSQALVERAAALHRFLVLRDADKVVHVGERVAAAFRQILGELTAARQVLALLPGLIFSTTAEIHAGAEERDDLAVRKREREHSAMLEEFLRNGVLLIGTHGRRCLAVSRRTDSRRI